MKEFTKCDCRRCNEIECCECGRPLRDPVETTTGICNKCAIADKERGEDD